MKKFTNKVSNIKAIGLLSVLMFSLSLFARGSTLSADLLSDFRTITGTVTDADNGETLIGVNIIYPNERFSIISIRHGSRNGSKIRQ